MSARYLVLVACLVLQICAGGIYAWSALVTPLREGYGFTALQTQLVFGTVLLTLTCVMIPAGRLQERYHPRPIAATGAVLFAVGYGIASVSGESFLLLWLGAGLIMGLALGCTYVCSMATGVKWFPRHKGLIMGLITGGYGAGAILMSQLTSVMRDSGWTVPDVFLHVGIGYGAVMLLAALCLRVPPRAEQELLPIVPLRQVFFERRFWQTFLVFLLGNLPGLMIIGSIQPIGKEQGLDIATAVLAISVLSVGNAGGRVFWGWMFDSIGRDRAVVGSMLLVVAAPILIWLAGDSSWLFLGAAFLVGLSFSSCLVLHPAYIAREYGANRFGAVYPWVSLAHGLGAVAGPAIGGATRDATGGYDLALLIATLLAALGLMAFWLLRPRQYPSVTGKPPAEPDPLSLPPG
ncbi:MAG: MFS transporter [Phycisphaeraceae bacterium]|nr:MFS transporter [Phycisphaeraceae bacterium]